MPTTIDLSTPIKGRGKIPKRRPTTPLTPSLLSNIQSKKTKSSGHEVPYNHPDTLLGLSPEKAIVVDSGSESESEDNKEASVELRAELRKAACELKPLNSHIELKKKEFLLTNEVSELVDFESSLDESYVPIFDGMMAERVLAQGQEALNDGSSRSRESDLDVYPKLLTIFAEPNSSHCVLQEEQIDQTQDLSNILENLSFS